MDFAWVVDALRRGLRVTRKAWAGDPPMYLYMVTEKKPDGKRIIKMHTGTSHDFDWIPTAEQMLTVDDWEEYVEPKKDTQLRNATKETIKVTPEEMPLWPGVNADGYARMSEDSDVLIHDGVYRPKKGPVFGNTKLTFDESGQPHIGDTPILQFIRETTGSSEEPHGGKPVEEKPLDTAYDRDKQHRLEAIALDTGVRQGTTLEMLDTVFDVACQQVPACEDRWSKLKADLHDILVRKWLDEACSKWDQDDQEPARIENTNHEKEN